MEEKEGENGRKGRRNGRKGGQKKMSKTDRAGAGVGVEERKNEE